jgi:hypothetical protein
MQDSAQSPIPTLRISRDIPFPTLISALCLQDDPGERQAIQAVKLASPVPETNIRDTPALEASHDFHFFV